MLLCMQAKEKGDAEMDADMVLVVLIGVVVLASTVLAALFASAIDAKGGDDNEV